MQSPPYEFIIKNILQVLQQDTIIFHLATQVKLDSAYKNMHQIILLVHSISLLFY